MSELLKDGTLIVNVEDSAKIGRVLIEDEHHFGGLYYADRPKGEWRFIEGDIVGAYDCSNCGKISFRDSDFCPNCGAEMQNGEDDE